MFKSTVLVAAALLCAPAFAQETQTIPVRAALSKVFLDMKAPFIIGPGIDGDITLSSELLAKETPYRIQTILSTLPYKAEYTMSNGVHFIRRKSDTVVVPSIPEVNTTPPTISVAAPKVTFNPTTVLSYHDALQWELTRLELDRERAKSAQQDVDMALIRSTESAIALLKTRLSDLDASSRSVASPRTSRSTTVSPTMALSYNDALRLELLHAEMDMAEFNALHGPNHPGRKNKTHVLEFLKKKVAELDSRTAQSARKTAKR